MMIREAKDLDRLIDLFIRSDLEFSEEEPVSTDMVKAWEIVNQKDELLAGCVLAKREGKYIIDGIATEAGHQGKGLGAMLLDQVRQYLREVGAEELFLVARAPGFFKTQKFDVISREEGPLFFECFGCDQYKTSCFPEVMKLKID